MEFSDCLYLDIKFLHLLQLLRWLDNTIYLNSQEHASYRTWEFRIIVVATIHLYYPFYLFGNEDDNTMMGVFEISIVGVADGKKDGSDSDIDDAEYYAKEVEEKPEAGQSVGQWHFIATT